MELLAPQKQVSRERPSGADFSIALRYRLSKSMICSSRIPLSSRRTAGVLMQARMVVGLILRDDARQKGECKRSIKKSGPWTELCVLLEASLGLFLSIDYPLGLRDER